MVLKVDFELKIALFSLHKCLLLQAVKAPHLPQPLHMESHHRGPTELTWVMLVSHLCLQEEGEGEVRGVGGGGEGREEHLHMEKVETLPKSAFIVD